MLAYIVFNIFIAGLVLLDLGLFNLKAHVIGTREALRMSAMWIVVALGFNVFVFFWRGPQAGVEFFSGWLLEKSLSVDNLFCFAMIFAYFKVKQELQRIVLLWGILSALVLRGAMIALGTALLSYFEWTELVFGAFLLYTGVKLLRNQEHDPDIAGNPLLRLARRCIRVTQDYHGSKFFVVVDGLLHATPLLVVLLVVESTDVLFAVDSVPAVIGVTQDSFIVYTSNVLAILGLRALYFLLATAMVEFVYLNYGLGFIIGFVGAKMIALYFIEVDQSLSIGFTLGVIVVTLFVSIYASIREKKHKCK